MAHGEGDTVDCDNRTEASPDTVEHDGVLAFIHELRRSIERASLLRRETCEYQRNGRWVTATGETVSSFGPAL